MKSSIIPLIQAIIAPITAPAVPAVLLGAEIFRVLSAAHVIYLLALFSAIAGAIAIETSGGLAFFMAVRGWQRKQWGVMTVAGLSAGLYLSIVIGAILLIPGIVTYAVAVMSGIAVVAYIGTALFFADRQIQAEQTEQFSQQLELLRQKRLTINAQTRRVKAETTGGVRGERTGEQGEQTEDELRLAAFAYLNSHGDVGVRPLARALKAQLGSCSTSTAKKHRDNWLQENGK